MQLDGLRIRCAAGGNAGGTTVLFLSPLPQSTLAYDATWAKLAATFNLVAFDLPGFGRSEDGVGRMTFAAQSAFLQMFIDTLGLSDVYIVARTSVCPRRSPTFYTAITKRGAFSSARARASCRPPAEVLGRGRLRTGLRADTGPLP